MVFYTWNKTGYQEYLQAKDFLETRQTETCSAYISVMITMQSSKVPNSRKEKSCYKLYLTAKSPSTAYASLRYWVTTEEFYPWVCEYYALSGKLLKTAYFKSYKEMLGRQRPTEFEIHDAVKTTYKTIIYYTNMELKELPDKYFQKDYMTYIRWQ